MFEAVVAYLNHAGTTMTAALVNTAVATICGFASSLLISRFRGWSAATRYVLWWLVMAFVIAAPFASIVLPKAPVSSPVTVKFQPPAVLHMQRTMPMADRPVRLNLEAVLLLAWFAAAGIQAVRLLCSFFCSFQLKQASRPANRELQSLFDGLAVSSRPVLLRLSDHIPSPAVVGYLHPQVLMPLDLSERLSATELEQILMHELAHAARYDDWAIALQRILEAAFCWHPFVRYLGYKLNRDRESACDDRVTSSCEPKSYAACLAKVAQLSPLAPNGTILVPLLERKAELLSRVEFLLDKTRTHVPRISVGRLVLALGTLLAIVATGLQTPRLLGLPAPESPIQEPPSPKTIAEKSISGIHSVIVTLPDGQSSTFGSWSGSSEGDGEREPGTIEFTSDHRSYVIRDHDVLAKAQEILEPMEKLGRAQSGLGEQQSKLGEAQSKLGEELEKAADSPLDEAAAAKLTQELIAEVNAKWTAKTVAESQEQLAQLLQSRLGELQSEMGSEQGKVGEEQARLGELQGQLGAQQGELGKQEAALGAQQAAEANRAETKLKVLIHDALGRGLAKEK